MTNDIAVNESVPERNPRDMPLSPAPSTVGSQPALARDTKVMMAFQNQKKSVGVAYLLWFFLGMLGAHRFYLGSTGAGVAILLLTILIGWTLVGLIIPAIWVLIDAFLIPGIAQKKNQQIMDMLSM